MRRDVGPHDQHGATTSVLPHRVGAAICEGGFCNTVEFTVRFVTVTALVVFLSLQAMYAFPFSPFHEGVGSKGNDGVDIPLLIRTDAGAGAATLSATPSQAPSPSSVGRRDVIVQGRTWALLDRRLEVDALGAVASADANLSACDVPYPYTVALGPRAWAMEPSFQELLNVFAHC